MQSLQSVTDDGEFALSPPPLIWPNACRITKLSVLAVLQSHLEDNSLLVRPVATGVEAALLSIPNWL